MPRRVCIVTGASSGIGFETASLLARSGETVYAAARRLEKMEPLKEYGVVPVVTDVTDEAALKALVDRVIAEQGRIDVIVNNAGYGLYGAVEEVSDEAARAQFDVNFFAAASLIRLVLPYMRKQKSGTIVNVTSLAGKIYSPLGSYYHASKHALEGLSDCLRTEVAPFGIKTIIIEPGLIKTSWSGIMFDNLDGQAHTGAYDETVEGVKAMYEGFKYSEPEVIAKTILKAVNKKNPRARYRAGKYADYFVLGHKFLPTRVFDATMLSTVEKSRRAARKTK